ncbi:MAG: hypothetical protein PHX51_07770 [Clostridia bacterium]|nr:hypothetical protein [Clostridia bacterium]
MREEDKKFAIRYYYYNLVEGKGIHWEDYHRDFKLFLLYEYCEWIMCDSRPELSAYYKKAVKELVQDLTPDV